MALMKLPIDESEVVCSARHSALVEVRARMGEELIEQRLGSLGSATHQLGLGRLLEDVEGPRVLGLPAVGREQALGLREPGRSPPRSQPLSALLRRHGSLTPGEPQRLGALEALGTPEVQVRDDGEQVVHRLELGARRHRSEQPLADPLVYGAPPLSGDGAQHRLLHSIVNELELAPVSMSRP